VFVFIEARKIFVFHIVFTLHQDNLKIKKTLEHVEKILILFFKTFKQNSSGDPIPLNKASKVFEFHVVKNQWRM